MSNLKTPYNNYLLTDIETKMEELDNLSEKNEMLLDLLSVILQASAKLLHNRYRMKSYNDVETFGEIETNLSRINDYLKYEEVMLDGLSAACAVFYNNMEDTDGIYGWGNSSPDLRLIWEMSQSDISNDGLIAVLEHKSKYLEKIIMINFFDALGGSSSSSESE